MTSTRQSDMARKIAGLLALAEDAAKANNEALRDTYLEKATALQLKYVVDEAMLRKAEGSGREEIVQEDFCTESNTQMIKAKRSLINNIATLYRGKAVMMGEWTTAKGTGKMKYDKRAKIRVWAHRSDMDFIRSLYVSLILQMQTMMAADERAERAYGDTSAAAWRVSYAHAWVNRVYVRLEEMKRRQERDANATTPGTALVLRDRTQLVADLVDNSLGKLRSTKVRVDAKSLSGARAGRDAADRADLGGRKVGSNRAGEIGA